MVQCGDCHATGEWNARAIAAESYTSAAGAVGVHRTPYRHGRERAVAPMMKDAKRPDTVIALRDCLAR